MDSQLDQMQTQHSILKPQNQQAEHPQVPLNHPKASSALSSPSRASSVNRLLLVAAILLGGWLVELLWERVEQQLRSNLQNALRTQIKDTSDMLELTQLIQLSALKIITQNDFVKSPKLQQKLDKQIEGLEQVQKKIAQQEQNEKQQKENHEKIIANIQIQKEDHGKIVGELKKKKEYREKIIAELSKKQMKSGYVSKPPKGAPANIENPGVVIDIEYPQKDYLPLPIDFMRKNAQGKTIAEVLYADAEQRKKREEFHKERIAFLDARTYISHVYLAKYNKPLTEAAEQEGRKLNEVEWVRLSQKYGLDKIKTELPMCIMVPGYNNNANFRIQYNLNSVFSQNYSNYKLVIVDDKSTDGSGTIYRNYFAFHRIDKSRYAFIQNSKRVTALANIYVGTLNHCGEDSIVLNLDADDQLIGRNTLQMFNWGYQNKKAGVLYSNFIRFQHQKTLMYGFTSDYGEDVKKENLYRYKTMQFSHLRSYRNELFGQIDPKDLQDDKGAFFTIAYSPALFFPLMELSCGRVHKIEDEFHYLYNVGTGLNDYNDRERQIQVDKKVRERERYECYKDFDKRMSQ